MLSVAICDMPAQLHPVSQLFLDHYINGQMSLQAFLRFFSLPNSDYIPLAQCIVNWINPLGLG